METAALTAADVKRILGLQPHPREGGWYVRTYESDEQIAALAFSSARYGGDRRASTAIYYLLEPESFSEMHILRSDEIFHHYLGGPVEMLQLHPNGTSEHFRIGKDIAAGERPQAVVKRGVWQGSKLVEPAGFALIGCTVSPGFEFEDYGSLPRAELIAHWPHEASLITQLTRR